MSKSLNPPQSSLVQFKVQASEEIMTSLVIATQKSDAQDQNVDALQEFIEIDTASVSATASKTMSFNGKLSQYLLSLFTSSPDIAENNIVSNILDYYAWNGSCYDKAHTMTVAKMTKIDNSDTSALMRTAMMKCLNIISLNTKSIAIAESNPKSLNDKLQSMTTETLVNIAELEYLIKVSPELEQRIKQYLERKIASDDLALVVPYVALYHPAEKDDPLLSHYVSDHKSSLLGEADKYADYSQINKLMDW